MLVTLPKQCEKVCLQLSSPHVHPFSFEFPHSGFGQSLRPLPFASCRALTASQAQTPAMRHVFNHFEQNLLTYIVMVYCSSHVALLTIIFPILSYTKF